MALPIFNPLITPQPSTQVSFKPKLLQAEFGDGYTQVTRDGLNHVRREVKLVWTSIAKVYADAIISFLEWRGGDLPFIYTVPDDLEPKRWRCVKWDKQFAANDRRSITADLVQDFGRAQ